MLPGHVFLVCINSRCAVARYEAVNGGLKGRIARNWEELEPQAREAVLAQGGSVKENGNYACPEDLAAQAQWD